jgi:CubicO group peptidase (beta-lactamase class C family)
MQQDTFAVEQIRDFINDSLALWKVQGVAVAVVRNGEILLSEGFGLRNVENQLPVTPQTLFPIASCTKAFTAMSLGLLVDAGKLTWDKPVKEYLPGLKLHDPFATERITPRDLITHRSGLPRHDLIWYGSNFSRQEILKRLRHLEFSEDLRVRFQYNNLMFMTAGLVVSELTGMSWERYTQENILNRLGMQRTNFSTVTTQESADFALPYLERDGEVKQVPFYKNDGENDAVGPAGNIISCVDEMAHWLGVHTSGGFFANERFISTPNLHEMHKPQMVIEDEFGRIHFDFSLSSYGLGWFLHGYKGQILSEHGGNLDGFSSLTSVIRQAGLGIVVLCNGNNTALPSVITHTIYDRLLGLEPTDWNARLKPLWDTFRSAEKQGQARTAAARVEASPSHALTAYVGDYEHPGYGVMSIRQAADGMEMVLNDKLTLSLTHYHYDYFEAYFATFDLHIMAMFTTDPKGKIYQLSVQMEPAVKDIVFTRQPDKKLQDPAFLQQFVGAYEFLRMRLEIQLKENNLTVTPLGQEERILVPYQGTEFQLKGLSGFSMEFKQGEDGNVAEVVFAQPGAAFTAKKVA